MKIIYIFILAFLLISCATTSKMPYGTNHLSWNARQNQLYNLDNWDLYGVVGIKNSKQNAMAHVDWQQSADSYVLNITSQFNVGGIKITGDKNQVILWRSTTEQVTAKTSEKLMQQELGWSLPISNLRYWALGLPAPQLAYKPKFDTYNHLISLQQQGWKISYSDFVAVNNIDLPTTILLNNANLQIKIVVKQWDLKSTL